MTGAAVLGRMSWKVCTVVGLRVTAADGYSAVRDYPMASAPRADGRIELSVERLADGEVSA
jgi:ferredoxin-NADP reductase